MNCETISLLPDLDRASDTRKPNVCRRWNNALRNENGVLTQNVRKFERRRGCTWVEIKVALIYPNVFFSFNVSDAKGGEGHPLFEGSENFNVHDHPANAMLMVEHALRDACERYNVKEEMIVGALEDMRAAITEE